MDRTKKKGLTRMEKMDYGLSGIRMGNLNPAVKANQ